MITGTRWAAVAIVLALALAACTNDDGDATAGDGSVSAGSEESALPVFSEADCPSPIPRADGFRCGTVTVPMRRGDDRSPTIDLAVAVLPAPGPGKHDDAVIRIDSLEPSIAGYEGVEGFPEGIDRDVVLVDIRGMGLSTPSLECTEIDYLTPRASTDPDLREEYLEALERCRERLEDEGIDLGAYTIDAIAADMVDIRRALGYERWNVVGFGNISPEDPGMTSTEIVLQLMRTDGDAIRSVTIESPIPPDLDPWNTQVESLARAIDAVSVACQGQPPCAQAHPDFSAALAQVLQAPSSEHAVTSAAGDPMTVVMDPPTVSYHTWRGLSAHTYVSLVPSLVGSPGGAEEVARVIAGTTAPELPENVAVHGVLLSVLCGQTGAASSPEDRTTDTAIGLQMWGTIAQSDSCERWGAAEPDASLDEPVRSDIPTLLLVGQFDPRASLAGARRLAGTLANGYAYEVPAATANPFGHSECAREIRNTWVQDPEREPDPSCLTSVPALVFSP